MAMDKAPGVLGDHECWYYVRDGFSGCFALDDDQRQCTPIHADIHERTIFAPSVRTGHDGLCSFTRVHSCSGHRDYAGTLANLAPATRQNRWILVTGVWRTHGYVFNPFDDHAGLFSVISYVSIAARASRYSRAGRICLCIGRHPLRVRWKG